MSSIESDIYQIQYLSLLIGIQGSGMINGLYLSQFTSVVAFYLNSGWPLSNGDPLEYVSARGPYIRHINQNESQVICSRKDDKVTKSFLVIFNLFLILNYLFLMIWNSIVTVEILLLMKKAQN